MRSNPNDFYAVCVYPNKQKIILYMTFHASFIIAM